ncbi:hypothetical protein [Oceanimonas sp. MB9]|uniref:hypothetical protein n=1 Tax=Oceanimonas sp. MB9 TaxID=2588453 RepID=UPI0013F5A962|nr:hypothetical protein [Oceanimonas sp. MB9]NHI00781.1 hypothetical protein [Oceanimonas sp. MB9]
MRKHILPAIALFSLFVTGAASADGIDRHEKRMKELRDSHGKYAQSVEVLPNTASSHLAMKNGSDGVDRHDARMAKLREARG